MGLFFFPPTKLFQFKRLLCDSAFLFFLFLFVCFCSQTTPYSTTKGFKNSAFSIEWDKSSLKKKKKKTARILYFFHNCIPTNSRKLNSKNHIWSLSAEDEEQRTGLQLFCAAICFCLVYFVCLLRKKINKKGVRLARQTHTHDHSDATNYPVLSLGRTEKKKKKSGDLVAASTATRSKMLSTDISAHGITQSHLFFSIILF